MKEVTINIDFDGTVVTHAYPDIGYDIGAGSVLRDLVEAGHKLILFTMRSGEKLEEAVLWFEEKGIELYGVQTNPEQSTWTTSPKSYAQVMIDDSSLFAPLKSSLLSHRPYMDWVLVRERLVARGLLV